MMNLQQALIHGNMVGVRYYIYNSHGCLVGGTKTREQALQLKRKYEEDDRTNPFTHGTTRFTIVKKGE